MSSVTSRTFTELTQETHIDISMWLARSAGRAAEINSLMELFLEWRDPKTGEMFIEKSNAA